MIKYHTKLREVADAVEAKRRPFTLFGLFMREDSPGLWDLVVSAPWLERGRLKAFGEFVDALRAAIGEAAIQSFSRIVTLNRDDAALKAILDEGRGSRRALFEAGSEPIWVTY